MIWSNGWFIPRYLTVLIGLLVFLCTYQYSQTDSFRELFITKYLGVSVQPQVFIPFVATNRAIKERASWGAPIAVSPRDGSIWAVNPDAGTVSAIDAVHFIKIAEVDVGTEPWSLAF